MDRAFRLASGNPVAHDRYVLARADLSCNSITASGPSESTGSSVERLRVYLEITRLNLGELRVSTSGLTLTVSKSPKHEGPRGCRDASR